MQWKHQVRIDSLLEKKILCVSKLFLLIYYIMTFLSATLYFHFIFYFFLLNSLRIHRKSLYILKTELEPGIYLFLIKDEGIINASAVFWFHMVL